MFINLSNHPYDSWSEEQKEASLKFGKCIDLPFPTISPCATGTDIKILARDYLDKIMQIANASPNMAVHIMGEQTFCYILTAMLQQKGVRCFASCTDRDVTILPDGSKQVRFHFSRFRDYPSLFNNQ